jgi:SAM-dependent methyltransferase
MATAVSVPNIDLETLRCEISKEYAEVASNPTKGFHFHTGRKLAKILGYSDDHLAGVPERSIESFAGTGNPFSMGDIHPGENVVDIGSGAGIDNLIAARMTGPSGKVMGTDMTPHMLDRARAAAGEAGLENVEFHRGHAESLPVPDGWGDVVISNGVVNLCPDKSVLFREMHRVLKPGGRLQIGDILVQKEVPQSAKDKIELWTG